MAEGKTESWAKAPYSIHREGLGPWARWVYTVLLDESRGTGTVKMGMRRLAKTLRTESSTVVRAIAELESRDLITIARGENGVSNSYFFETQAPKTVRDTPTVRRKKPYAKRVRRPCAERLRGVGVTPTEAHAERVHKTRETSSRGDRGERAPRKQDPIWDVVEELWYSDGIPEHQRSRVGKWVQTLKDLNATADEIRVRHKRAVEWYERKRATVKAVIDHWSELKNDSSTGKSRPGRVECSPGEYADIKPFSLEG